MNEDATLLIWDVDGTLTDSAGLTRVAFEKAFEGIYGISGSTKGIMPFGRTDPQIFREMLRNSDLHGDDFPEQFRKFGIQATHYLEKELQASNKPRLHHGVRELLDLLAVEDDVFMALGTGNIERNARLKLEKHSISHLFPVGGFGSDDEDRTTLIKIAFLRSKDYFSIDFAEINTWVIGDTYFDIKCGNNIGANTIAVATGNASEAELSEHNPTAVFADLRDGDRFINLIGNHGGRR
ncbi:HAD hydrolase-like protein [bacterium]|nr:HAD hydrolase-like protein [bacterium]